MIKEFTDDFDIRKIANSGQCFRFNEIDDNLFENIAFEKVLKIRFLGNNTYDFDCDEKEFDDIWKDYFDLETDYRIIRSLTANDPLLKQWSDDGAGIRILRQDSFEALISFIISQRKSIPAIKTSIERLCSACGVKINSSCFAFPTPEAIQACDSNILAGCGLGYRLSYIKKAAEAFAFDSTLTEKLSSLSDDDLFFELKNFNGVGDKVASCTALFGFHRLNFFPKDVWINRALESKYPQGFDYEKYEPYNGVIQQYIFFSYRPGLTEL